MQRTKPKLWHYKSGKNKGKLRKKSKQYLSFKSKEYWKSPIGYERRLSMKGKPAFRRKSQRYSYVVNFPLHETYWGILGQIWTNRIFKKRAELEYFIQDKVKDCLLDYLKYSESDLWFEIVGEGEGWQNSETKEKNNSWMVVLEDSKGSPRRKWRGIK